MGALLAYSIISGLALLALYLPYRALLARENQHAYNRAVLLAIYTLAFAAPMVVKIAGRISLSTVAPAVAIGLGEAVLEGDAAPTPIWGTMLIWAYAAGMAALGIKTIATWARLVWIVSRGERISKKGYTFVLTDNEAIAPFSWMHFIVMSRKDYAESGSAILAHEQAHVAGYHWIDLLVAQAACVVCWYNPAAWLMRESLMLVHEYQADNAVLSAGYDAQEYQLLLIKKAVGSRFPSLANSLNHSKLKKRITMMYRKKSGAGRKLKVLALVPAIALALGVAAVPAVRAAITTISSSSPTLGKVSEISANSEISAEVSDETKTEVVETPEVMPKYPGGESAIFQAVMKKVTYPDPKREWKPEADGLCVVSFTVNPDGTIGNVQCTKSCGYDDFDQAAIDAVKEALTEKWTPGTVGGKPVAVSYSIPIRFKQK